ncbi:MAG TPA: sulfatase [Methanosarcinales archaeon]|nr:sulfatase [Methanosarcinales archaeon]
MSVCSLVDIAPAIAELIDVPLPGADGVVRPELTGLMQRCSRVVLIIVDSLGYSTYRRLKPSMPFMKGTLIRCGAVSDHTTPAIASILSGCYPETHRVFTTADVLTSSIKSVLERAEECGVKAAVVIETDGAAAMKTKIELSEGVPDSSDIIAYDAAIKEHAIDLLKLNPTLMVLHFRAIDRYAHEGRSFDDLTFAAESIDRHIAEICEHVLSDSCIIVCGDHPVHGNCTEDDRDVALIIFRAGDV